MAKVKAKSGLRTTNKVLFIIFIVLLVATIVIVSFSSPKVPVAAVTESESSEDAVVIDAFQAGTYGGVEFSSIEDVANYYVECYNNTKAQTAQYKDNGETKTYYALLGEEDLQVTSLLIDGKENGVINNLVPSVIGSLWHPSTYSLPPCSNRDPEKDNTDDDEGITNSISFDERTSNLKAEDILEANVSETSDGKIQLIIQPKAAELAMRGADSQGDFFEVLGDIKATVNDITVLSWAEGDTDSNVIVTYKGGSGTVIIDPATKTITDGDYHMAVTVDVKHANVAVVKDKNAKIIVSYDMHYPASDEYLKKNISIERL